MHKSVAAFIAVGEDILIFFITDIALFLGPKKKTPELLRRRGLDMRVLDYGVAITKIGVFFWCFATAIESRERVYS